MRHERWLAVVVFGTVAGCGHEFEPPDRATRVQEAAATYSATVFDSLEWASEDVRLSDGNEIYAASCRRCHGTLGRGETSYARERDLDVPSLVEPDWQLADLDTLRKVIFIGHEEGMPVFGDGGLVPREIDGVAAYILWSLRPDVLEAGAAESRDSSHRP